MKEHSKASKLKSIAKACTFVALAAMSFSTFAYPMYVGNPTRPDTIWVPGQCEHGCWREGHYVKFINPPIDCTNVVWVDSRYDANGNYIPAHFVPRHTVIVGSY